MSRHEEAIAGQARQAARPLTPCIGLDLGWQYNHLPVRRGNRGTRADSLEKDRQFYNSGASFQKAVCNAALLVLPFWLVIELAMSSSGSP
jgi:hypothetical protein